MRDSIDFKTMNIPKLFRKLLIPTVLGMIFNAIFIITDGIFVGKGIGSDALAAVNITAPLFLINTGVALMFGIGASVVASVHLSQGKAKVARINVTQAIIVSSVLLLIYAIGIVSNVERVAVWSRSCWRFARACACFWPFAGRCAIWNGRRPCGIWPRWQAWGCWCST